MLYIFFFWNPRVSRLDLYLEFIESNLKILKNLWKKSLAKKKNIRCLILIEVLIEVLIGVLL